MESTEERKKKKTAKGFWVKLCIAVVGSTLTALIFTKAAPWGTGILASVVAALMGYEMAVPTGWVKSRFVSVLTVICAAAVPWAVYAHLSLDWMACGLFVLIAVLFGAAVLSEKGPSVPEILHAAVAIFLFPLLLSLMPEILRMENGRRLVVLPILIAWCADGGAQIVGMLCGRHKLIPRISPAKTVEGFFGGMGGAVLGTCIYAGILSLRGAQVRWGLWILLAIVGMLFSVLGDLSLSLVKRSCGIKDFGRLLPEHGGVLDRFDSVLFVLPVCRFAFQFLDFFA